MGHRLDPTNADANATAPQGPTPSVTRKNSMQETRGRRGSVPKPDVNLERGGEIKDPKRQFRRRSMTKS